jgi:uncharacterized protein (DUF433 family)/flavin-binding protein dodecin
MGNSALRLLLLMSASEGARYH